MLENKHLILAKIESAYGVDPTPTPTADAVIVSNLSIGPAVSANKREAASGSLSPWLLAKPTIGPMEIKFSVELRGSGTANLPTEFGPILRACGLAESILATPNRVEYDPLSSAFPSVAIYAYPGGVLHKCLGCVGTAELILEAGKKGMINFTLQCPYLIPTDAAIPSSAVYDTPIAPLVENINLTIGGYAMLFAKLQIALNNTLSKRTSGNAPFGLAGMAITKRETAGSVDPEAVTRATHDFWQLMQDATPAALSAVVGTTSGNRWTITGPQVQYSSVAWGAREGQRIYEVPLHFARSAGDDEVKFKHD